MAGQATLSGEKTSKRGKEMHKKTIGLLIVLGLSNSLAMAQEFAVPKGKVVEDDVLAVRNSEDAKERPEVTMSPVISDILVKGGNMHLTLRFWVDSDQIKGQAHKQILEIATALNSPGADRQTDRRRGPYGRGRRRRLQSRSVLPPQCHSGANAHPEIWH